MKPSAISYQFSASKSLDLESSRLRNSTCTLSF